MFFFSQKRAYKSYLCINWTILVCCFWVQSCNSTEGHFLALLQIMDTKYDLICFCNSAGNTVTLANLILIKVNLMCHIFIFLRNPSLFFHFFHTWQMSDHSLLSYLSLTTPLNNSSLSVSLLSAGPVYQPPRRPIPQQLLPVAIRPDR